MKNKNIKFSSIVILILLLLFVSGCRKDPGEDIKEDIQLTILSINDFHGQLEETEDGAGAARIASYVDEVREDYPDSTLLLAAGDMFQGTALSNVGYGEDVITFMNMLDFDAMTIGNHEFDWTLDKVLSYRDGDKENGEADFPFLSTNIYQHSIDGLPEELDEYVIVERMGIKIAIIGFIGENQKEDISPSMCADYTFTSPLEEVRENIKEARTEDDVDIVIVMGHEDDSKLTNSLANGTGEYAVDAIINAHTHDLENSRIYRPEDKRHVTVVQSKSSGEYVGHTTLTIDPETKEVKNSAVRNVRMTSTREKDAEVESFVATTREKYAHIFDRELCVAGCNISRPQATKWAVNALYDFANTEYGPIHAAFINNGGIRANAFPINKDDIITVNTVYKIMPFDNMVKVTELTGKQLLHALRINDFVYSDNCYFLNGNYYVNEEVVDENAVYRVIAVDYIFDNESYPFVSGNNTIITEILLRDILIKDLEKLGQNDELWLC